MNIENLKDLAPTLVGDFTCEDTSDIIFNEYSNKFTKYKKNIEIGSKYFFGNLHDSNILSCKFNKGNLYLKLNEIATYNFAHELIKKMELKINIRKMIFPLEIISENTNELSLNIIDKKGKIFKNKIIKLDEYISEEIIEWTDKNIKIAFNLWSKRIKYKFDDYKNCKNYLLYLSCNKIKINEMQNIYWKKYFGNKYDKYYNIFLEERNKGKALSDSKLDEIFSE